MAVQTETAVDADRQLADLIVEYPQLLTPLMRMGIGPALGNTTLRQASQNSSLGLELSTELLELAIGPHHEPKPLVRYSLLPLSDFYCKSLTDIRPWLKIMSQHLMRMGGNGGSNTTKPVLTLFENFNQQMGQAIATQEKALQPAIQHLYELFYSPTCEQEDEEVLKEALQLTAKDDGDQPVNLLEDIISLLLRHTPVMPNDISFCGAIQQLCNLRSAIEYIERIRVKLLHPMVSDMVRTIRRRQKRQAL